MIQEAVIMIVGIVIGFMIRPRAEELIRNRMQPQYPQAPQQYPQAPVQPVAPQYQQPLPPQQPQQPQGGFQYGLSR